MEVEAEKRAKKKKKKKHSKVAAALELAYLHRHGQSFHALSAYLLHFSAAFILASVCDGVYNCPLLFPHVARPVRSLLFSSIHRVRKLLSPHPSWIHHTFIYLYILLPSFKLHQQKFYLYFTTMKLSNWHSNSTFNIEKGVIFRFFLTTGTDTCSKLKWDNRFGWDGDISTLIT